ncbi:MAG: hypothetical protein KAR22_12885 [Gammaproteobacteria bacterium]|nr:hypothetical protein [Gammaproteobacteria bacterium]
MKTYTGDRTIDGISVLVDGRPLGPRFDLRRFSDTGFEWTYEGGAPAQLALALLAEHFQDDDKALAHHEGFMREIVANFDNEWVMTSEDVDTALANILGDVER